MPPTIFWNTTAIGRPAARMVATEARPIENATGTPSSSSSVKLTREDGQFHAGHHFLAAQQRDDVFDREQHDQHAGDDQRQVVHAHRARPASA